MEEQEQIEKSDEEMEEDADTEDEEEVEEKELQDREIVRDKINKLGVQETIISLRSKGYDLKEIARFITQETGVKVSHVAVWRWLKGFNKSKKKLLKDSQMLQKMQIKREIDLIDDLVKTKIKLQKYLDSAFEKEEKHIPAAVNALTKQLELIAKLLGELRVHHETKNINIDVKEIGPTIAETIKKYQKAGKLYCKRCRSRDISFDMNNSSVYEE